MAKFKAYRVFNADGKIAARQVDISLEDLSAGEVVIRTAYSSVNYKDALAATGAGKIMRKFPLVGGIDVAGSVESSRDPRFQRGQLVLVTGYDLGVAHDGGYAEYARVPADWVVPIPAGLSEQEAMAIGTAGFTAALSVVRLEQNGLTPGSGPVVVTGASGGVGSLAVDMLAGAGYQVTAITGKDDQHAFLREIGAAEVWSRQTLELGTKPLEKSLWAGAIDPVGGAMLSWLTRSMQYGGGIANSGLTGGIEIHTTVMPFILRSVSLIGIDSALCPMPLRLQVWHRLGTDLKPRHLAALTHMIGYDALHETFARLLGGGAAGRYVVQTAA